MNYYVYVIIDPRNLKPMYVGKGKANRMYRHWSDMMNGNVSKCNRKLYNKLTFLFRLGYTSPLYEKLFMSTDEQLVYAMEVFWIATIGRKNLCNRTDGGDAPPIHRGADCHLFGQDHRGANNAFFGRRHSHDSLTKMSIAHSGRKITPEHIEILRQANLGRPGVNRKLTEADVLSIRADSRFQRIIASDYGVDQAVISRIKSRKAWFHVAGHN